MYYAQLEAGLRGQDSELWTNILSSLLDSSLTSVNSLGRVEMIKILGRTAQAMSESTTVSVPKMMQMHTNRIPFAVTTGWSDHTVGMVVLWQLSSNM